MTPLTKDDLKVGNIITRQIDDPPNGWHKGDLCIIRLVKEANGEYVYDWRNITVWNVRARTERLISLRIASDGTVESLRWGKLAVEP